MKGAWGMPRGLTLTCCDEEASADMADMLSMDE